MRPAVAKFVVVNKGRFFVSRDVSQANAAWRHRLNNWSIRELMQVAVSRSRTLACGGVNQPEIRRCGSKRSSVAPGTVLEGRMDSLLSWKRICSIARTQHILSNNPVSRGRATESSLISDKGSQQSCTRGMQGIYKILIQLRISPLIFNGENQ